MPVKMDSGSSKDAAESRRFLEKLLADCRGAQLPSGGPKLTEMIEEALAALPPPQPTLPNAPAPDAVASAPDQGQPVPPPPAIPIGSVKPRDPPRTKVA